MGSTLLNCPFCGAKNASVARKKLSLPHTVLLLAIAVGGVAILTFAMFRSPEIGPANEAAPSAKVAPVKSSDTGASPAPIAGVCSKPPGELFPVGARFESNALVELADKECPNARYFPDEHFEVAFEAGRFSIQTKKLNFTGPAFYEIVSVHAVSK